MCISWLLLIMLLSMHGSTMKLGKKRVICIRIYGINYSISQIIQLGAQFCLNIFIYVFSVHVSGIQVPIIRRKLLYLCDTDTCHSERRSF